MTIKEIITKWLKENGFDGLCFPEEDCGCGLEDLMPCDGPIDSCQPGYAVTRRGYTLFITTAGPEPVYMLGDKVLEPYEYKEIIEIWGKK